MSIILTVIAMVVMLSLIVGVHEFGHMIFAKWFGVKVYQYSIGMGPIIKKWKRKDVEYTLRWFLVGGFVLLSGTIPHFMKGKPVYAAIEDGHQIRYFGRKNKLKKIWSGNIVRIVPTVIEPDILHDKDGKMYKILENAEFIFGNSKYPIEREGERLVDKPLWQQIIVFIAGAFFNFVLSFILIFIVAACTQTKGALFDVEITWKIVFGLIKDTFGAVGHIITPHGINKQVGGTVYVVNVVHQAVKTSFWNGIGLITLFTGFLSLSVGVMNLLPIPPLDGFHVIRVIVDKIVRWSYPVLTVLTIIGTLAIITLAVIVNVNNLIEMIH